MKQNTKVAMHATILLNGSVDLSFLHWGACYYFVSERAIIKSVFIKKTRIFNYISIIFAAVRMRGPKHISLSEGSVVLFFNQRLRCCEKPST